MSKEEKKPIRRNPIILDKNTIAVIHMFHRYDDLEDVMWMSDMDRYMEENFEQYQKSAEQFISQLKEHWTVAFMENLIKESFKAMYDDKGAFNEKVADKLINELIEMKNKTK